MFIMVWTILHGDGTNKKAGMVSYEKAIHSRVHIFHTRLAFGAFM